jgi:Acetyltransferase (GNAT) domain
MAMRPERLTPAMSGAIGAVRHPRSVLIPVGDLSARDVSAWRDLASRAAEPNPFFEAEAVIPAARHLAESAVAVLVVESSDHEWLACMPVTHRVGIARRRFPMLAGWRHLYSYLGTPLVDHSNLAQATECLLDGVLRTSHMGVVALPWIGDDGPVASSLLQALRLHRGRPAAEARFERAVLRRSSQAAGVRGLISASHYRDLRRLARRLAEKLDGPVAVHDLSQRAQAVEDFLSLEASGWKGERGTAMRSQAEHARYFRALCDGFRDAGRLQMLALGTEERSVSYQCNLLTADAVFQFKIAFDESCRHYRPGLQLEVRLMERFQEQMSQGWIDSCADPSSQLFAHLWPDRRPIGSYILTSHGVVGWTIDHAASHIAAHAGVGGR